MKIAIRKKIVKVKRVSRVIERQAVDIGRASSMVARNLIAQAKNGQKTITVDTSVWVNAILAPKEFVKLIEDWFTRFNINKDIYDTAIDSARHIGGSKLHHLIDGQHTVWDAFKAAKDASPEDTFFQEVTNTAEHLIRDMCSKSGISPFFCFTKDSYDKFASFSHIPREWLRDVLTFNTAELIGASVATVALVFGWSKMQSKQFAEYAGALGISAIVSANPLLGLVVIISTARAFTVAKKEKGFEKIKLGLAKSALKGTITPSIVISLSALIGGPVYIGLILGIIVAILVRKKIDDKNTLLKAL